MKDPKDILREMQADLCGITPDQVTFSNYRDRKRSRKKDKKVVESEKSDIIIDNGEGFGIVNREAETCSYADIAKKKRKLKQKNNLEEWGAFDFFLYAREKYTVKYGCRWDLGIGGGSLEINRIRDRFSDIFGFCCNLIMRDYIDFFFDNYIDKMIQSDGAFYFRQMRRDKIMSEFCEAYDFSQSFLRYTEREKIKDKDTISNLEIKEAYYIGDTSLVSNYGIVIAFNWLINVKKMSPTDTARLVLAACRELASKNMISVVKKATEVYSPYPSALSFKKPQVIMDKIDSSIKLNVEFNDNSKYVFMQVKEK